MAYSGNIVEYLGCGIAADRPASLNLTPGALGIYHASDTDDLSLWVLGAWQLRGSGGGIPDAPSDGNTYGRKNSAWAQMAAGGDVVGPASATADRIAVFDGGTGKLLKDGGLTIANLYFDSVTAATISSGTVTLDCNGGRARNFTISMTESATLAVSNLATAGRVTEFEVQITQDATGGRTLTLPGSFKALGGSDTAISASANSVTILSAKTFDAGTTWRYAMQESA